MTSAFDAAKAMSQLQTDSGAQSTASETLHLSVTRTWGNRTLPVDSLEWRTLRAQVLERDGRTCASCSYISSHPIGRGLQIDHRDGNASNNDSTNLRIHCPVCEAIRHCGFAGMKGWVQLGSSDMGQVEIVRKTRRIFEETGKIPRVTEVDPDARRVEINVLKLANKLMDTDWEELTSEEKTLRGFFTPKAERLFAVTMFDSMRSTSFAATSSNAQALKILEIEHSLPWIRFSAEKHSTIPKFLATWPPSTTSQKEVAWICVDNSRLKSPVSESDRDIPGLTKAWDALCAERQPSIADLDELAQRYGCLGGKWLCFLPSTEVDALWARVVSATHAGTLGTCAKVAPKNESDSHVICVFTADYMDSADLQKVRQGLRRLGVKQRISYKPDVYTHCRIYKSNEWNIHPSRYSS